MRKYLARILHHVSLIHCLPYTVNIPLPLTMNQYRDFHKGFGLEWNFLPGLFSVEIGQLNSS